MREEKINPQGQLSAKNSLSKTLVLTLTLATGLVVTTIYLLQPLLQMVSEEFQVSTEKIGMIVTLTQIGYGLGILFLIPLGDVLPKKKLILVKFVFLILALAWTALSGSYLTIVLASLFVGVFATTAQDIVPLAADLADEKSRGAVVGTLMSGLLLGILLSRTASGFLADHFGWRAVFWIVAAILTLLALILFFAIPNRSQVAKIPYSELLKSTLQNFTNIPEVRTSIITQGLIGVAFSSFWTNLAFYVGRPPFEMSTSQIGLFGIAGAAGALAAFFAGKLSDRKGPHLGIMIGASLVVVSFLLMLMAPLSVFGLFFGAVVFDLGGQMALVSHQSIIYSLNPAARSRLNALFVACLFASFSIGSFISVQLFAIGGWVAVMQLCLLSSMLAVGFAALQHRQKLFKQR